MIKTNNLQKVFRTEEVETWALHNVSPRPSAFRNADVLSISIYNALTSIKPTEPA